MNTDLKEIKTGVGLGILKFGMERNEVKKLLGEPTEIEKYSYTDSDEDLTESWHYDELELSVSFDEDLDWKLSTLAVSSDQYELNGKKIIGIDQISLISALNSMGIKNLEKEDALPGDDPDSAFLISDEHAITFWLEEGIVSEIQWGPLVVDDDAVIWPE